MVIHTSLVEMVTPAELQSVMAHELGHLKCDHGVYLTLANIIVLGTSLLPTWGAAIAQQLQEQLRQWLRCAEFTCDRSAMLVSQDPKVVMSLLMKLAGGSPTLAPKLNLDAFVAQARAYDKMGDSSLGELLKQVHTSQLTHPLPVLRAREIDRWASTQNYQNLLQRSFSGYNDKTDAKGGWRNW